MSHMRWVVLAVFAAGCMTRETRDELEGPEPFSVQATKGAAIFAANCAECHGAGGEGTTKAPRLVGMSEGALPLDPPMERKKRLMQFRTAADIARFVTVNMPGDDPGSLSEADYFRVLAFALQANGIELQNQHLDMQLAESIVIPREGAPGMPVSRR